MRAPRSEFVDLARLRESPFNPRRRFGNLGELASSIKAQGVLQPLLVRPVADGLEIVVGHRRFRAAKLAGLKKAPAVIREMSDREVLEAQLVENSQREDIHPMEEAAGFERLNKEHGVSADEIAERIGKSRAHVYARLQLLQLAEPIREAFVKDSRLKADTVLEVARLQNERLQQRALDKLVSTLDSGQPMGVIPFRRWVKSAFKHEKRGPSGQAAPPREERERREAVREALLERVVATIEREREFEHHQVKLMALILASKASEPVLKRRKFPGPERLRAAAEKMTPTRARGLLFELVIEPWLGDVSRDYPSEMKMLARAFGVDLGELEKAEALFRKPA